MSVAGSSRLTATSTPRATCRPPCNWLPAVCCQLDFVAWATPTTSSTRSPRNGSPCQPEDSPVGELNLAAYSIRILDQITDTSYEGTEKKDGVKCYHINGMVAGAEVQAIAGSVDATKPFPTDIWVGVDDSLLYEVDIMGPMASKRTTGTWRSIVLSNLNVAVDIKAPL